MKPILTILVAALVCILLTEKKAPAGQEDDLHQIAQSSERIARHMEKMANCACKGKVSE